MTRNKRRKQKSRYRSGWEQEIADRLKALKIPFHYEEDVIQYTVPEKVHKYRPDFGIGPRTWIETKGKWTAQDRYRHLLLKQQHPEFNIYLVFQNANQKLRKGSKTTYGEWATKNGLSWSHREIKKEWIP